MKYHKIRNVPLHECTCEQKIAYNLAVFAWNASDAYNNSNASQGEKSRFISETARDLLRQYNNSHDHVRGKYDEDAIFCALNAGLEQYFIAKCPILTTYAAIGEMFPAHYLK